MLSLPPLVDNAGTDLEEVYDRLLPQIEEARIATGYFYLSGFDLYKDELETLADPDDIGNTPLRILMGLSIPATTSAVCLVLTVTFFPERRCESLSRRCPTHGL